MIIIMGVGNLLFGDEGFGPHFIKKYQDEIESAYDGKVTLLDAGTTTIPVLEMLEGASHLYIIDAVNVTRDDLKPGDVLMFEKDQLFKKEKSRVKVTAHSGGVQEMVATMELMGTMPPVAQLIGVVPQDISTGMLLSATLAEAMPKVKDVVIGLIEEALKEVE